MPILGVIGAVQERLSWGATPDTVRPYLPRNAELVCLDDTGHFVQFERPEALAALILEAIA